MSGAGSGEGGEEGANQEESEGRRKKLGVKEGRRERAVTKEEPLMVTFGEGIVFGIGAVAARRCPFHIRLFSSTSRWSTAH